MPLPDYKRPFDTEDFRGYFRWTRALTKEVGDKLYHACHRNELEEILEAGMLGLRSKWKLNLPKFGEWEAPGVWTGLNYFVNGNNYGPFVLEFPLSILEGKHFMVFRRTTGRHRHFFVQYEARIPIYSFGKTLWRSVDPKFYFKKSVVGAIWDIVLTDPIATDGITINPVDHPSCIPDKCKGSGLVRNRQVLKEVAGKTFAKVMRNSSDYVEFLRRFPTAAGLKVDLPELDEE